MVTVREAEEPSISLTKMALHALEEAAGDWDSALVLLTTWVRETDLLDTIIEDACYNAIRHAGAQMRRCINTAVRTDYAPTLPASRGAVIPFARPAPNPDRGAAGIEANVMADLRYFPLPGGKPLGEATPADLQAAIDFYRAQAHGHLLMVRRLELVLTAMGGGSRVDKTIPPSALERLWRQAEEG